MTAKKLFIKTWGCQMNVYDSARMADVVAPLGYTAAADEADADLVIFNTCHIREKATEKLFSELGRLRPQQAAKAERGERMLVAVAGCVAQAEGAEIKRRMPFVDMVFGPQTYHQLPEMIARVHREHGTLLNTEFPVEPKFDQLPPPQNTANGAAQVSAFLSIQEGCDKFCSFCVVPYTRGAEYSRPVEALIAEAQHLVQRGAREITLLGQNVNAFHGAFHGAIHGAFHGEDAGGNIVGFGALLFKLAEIPGLKRLRYMTSHPRDMDDVQIAAHRDLPQVMPFLHLPVQSGSDSVLAAMNRKHSADDYRRAIDRLRQARPDIALSSDFIVGFPGESNQDFADTLRLVRDVGFAQAFSFKYSRRPGTPAAAMTNQIAEDVKDARLAELQSLLRAQQENFNRGMIGKQVPVLFEGKGRTEGQLFGRTPYMQAVHAAAPARLLGLEMPVTITGANAHGLVGDVVVI